MTSENIRGTIVIMPDIEGIYYGRGVGYNVEEVIVTDEIKGISGTDIRSKLAAGDESWVGMVEPATVKLTRKYFNA